MKGNKLCLCFLLAAGVGLGAHAQNKIGEVDIRVTVSNEAFYTVQQPAAVFFAVSRFQHDLSLIHICDGS